MLGRVYILSQVVEVEHVREGACHLGREQEEVEVEFRKGLS